MLTMKSAEPIGSSSSLKPQLRYLRPGIVQPYHYMYAPPRGEPMSNCEFEERSVDITDARALKTEGIDVRGFELLKHRSSVVDFRDDCQVRTRMYPELQELALAVTGGTRAIIFDHQYRKRDAERRPLTFGREDPVVGPVGYVHNDYSEASGHRRCEAIYGGKPLGRVSIINIWRSAAGVVLDTPLALCDSRTVASAQLISSEIRYPSRIGEIFLVAHAPTHRWHYFSRLQPDEAIVFKQFDTSEGVSRYTPHAAFFVPVHEDTPLRESIETRILVIY